MKYETVIGLEVHAQLKTATKIWCGCSTKFGTEPNTNVCPVCTGMPGALPVLNRQAVAFAVKMGLALSCRINAVSIFARKNYFYPDLPMGYQISQYEIPVAEQGQVEIMVDGRPKIIGLTRIHLENDAGKSMHAGEENASQVDLNRAGIPLIEIVSEPDLRSPEECVAYLKALRTTLLYLEICDGNMEEGSFRCDANVSLRPMGAKAMGTRTEIKNMNSFRNVQRALELEIQRHRELLEDGEVIVQETRLYDADKGETRSMRGKEEANDYRYFPDPDLRPLQINPQWIESLRRSLPELPLVRKKRFMNALGLNESEAELLTADRLLADYFEQALIQDVDPRKIANWMTGEFLRLLRATGLTVGSCGLQPRDMAGIVFLVESGAISGNVGKKVLEELFVSGGDPDEYVRQKGLGQISDKDSLGKIVQEIVDSHPDEAARFRGGERKLMGFFVGQAMKATQGKADPKLVNSLLQKAMES